MKPIATKNIRKIEKNIKISELYKNSISHPGKSPRDYLEFF